MRRLCLVAMFACSERGAPAGPVACEGSALEPVAECAEGYCVDGEDCKPIFDTCGSSEVPILGGGCRRVGLPEECWDGWVPDGDDGCEPILPKDECPTGTMPVIGQAECQPVGLPRDCWPGWVNDGDGGCEPILPAGDCDDGEMPIIGEATCQPIGDCNAPPPIGPDVRHVDATVGPYFSIQDAIDAAQGGDTVYIAAGEYVEDVFVDMPLRIEGTCARDVILQGTGAAPFAVRASGTGSGFELRGVTVTGTAGGIRVQSLTEVVIEDVVVRDCEGVGIELLGGASGAIRRASLVGNLDAGVSVVAAAVTIEDVVARNTLARLDDLHGFGIHVDDGSEATVGRSVVLENRDVGLLVSNSTAVLHELIVRDTRPRQTDGLKGVGIAIEEGSKVTLTTSLVEDNRGVGVWSLASSAEIEDTVVRNTMPEGGGWYGRGISIEEASEVTVRRSEVSRNHQQGIFVLGSTAIIEDVVVRDTLPPREDGPLGQGIQAREGSDVTVRRSIVSRNQEVGFLVLGSVATVEDVVVRDTQPRASDEQYGAGIIISGGAGATVRRSLVLGNRGVGFLSELGSAATLEEVVVRDTQPHADGRFGRGVSVEYDSELELRRSLVSGNHDVGLLVLDSTATTENVVVSDTAARADGTFGYGVAIERGKKATGHANLARSLVRNSARVGVSFFAAGGGLEESLVRASGVAVALEQGADPAIADNVFEDNDYDVLPDSGIAAPERMEPLPP